MRYIFLISYLPFSAQNITSFGNCDSWKINTQSFVFFTHLKNTDKNKLQRMLAK
jgi:hypothetical protein